MRHTCQKYPSAYANKEYESEKEKGGVFDVHLQPK